jgi:hypothetical protein
VTRRSKREIERALEDLDKHSADADDYTPAVKEKYSDEVVEVIYRVARDVLRLSHRNADRMGINPSTAERTSAFLEGVREQYEITDDRDDAVLAGLDKAAATVDSRHWGPIDSFQTAVVSVPGEMDLATDGGDTLPDLVMVGDETAAEQLLVQQTYEMLAEWGQEASTR